MMSFAGEEVFEVPPDNLFQHLTDFNFLTRFVPGLESAAMPNDHTMECVVRPGFSFIRGTLKVKMEIVEKQAPNLARMRVHGKGIGNDVTIESSLILSPLDEGRSTTLMWSAEIVHLGGLLKAVSKGLIQGAAHKVVTNTWEQLRAELSLPPRG